MTETRARRLFRACGVAPLGAFVLLHVLGYCQVLLGRRSFGDPNALRVKSWELVLELLLVLLPLAYHGLYGLVLLFRARDTATPARPLLDRLQRWTSPLVLLFVVDHFARFRWPILSGELASSDAHALLVRELSANTLGLPLVAAFQLLGIAAVAFHLAYGVYHFGWSRLPWLAEPTRRTWLALLVGLLVLVPASFAVIGLATGKKLPFL
ncbi:MAG TPA: hypothetical protein VGP93_01975 [Polyangiaceae bacterium]|jgi:succinate dehydrogenase / fumarate reductase cytochrome b subunit|nr:hypothetical protein [Polyangiaceae bacterium]